MKPLTTWLALAALGLGFLTTPAWAHDVKDPVCRMTVDSDTAKYRHKLGNKSFYFCSKQCQTTFAKSPAKYEKLAQQLEKQDLHEYLVEFKHSENPTAGKPVELTFGLRYKDTGKLVQEFEVIHEKLLHLILTSKDLSWFEHQHPKRGADGLFRLTWTFPRAGQYRLYADFTPSDGDNQVLPVMLAVGGGPERTVPLSPDQKLRKQIGDLTFNLRLQGTPITQEKPLLLTYTIRDRNGRPVKDLQPFIGAMGHLLAISQDGEQVVHTHALQSVSQPSMGKEKEPFRVTSQMVTAKGPALSFKLTLPTSGLYRTWAQFSRGHRIYTIPFTFSVQDLWSKPAPVARDSRPAGPRTATGKGVQKLTVVIDGEYQPAQLAVKARQPVELTFVRKEEAGCGGTVRLPGLGITRTLKPGERSTVRFTPRQAGPVRFTCGMGMYRGQLLVR